MGILVDILEWVITGNGADFFNGKNLPHDSHTLPCHIPGALLASTFRVEEDKQWDAARGWSNLKGALALESGVKPNSRVSYH